MNSGRKTSPSAGAPMNAQNLPCGQSSNTCCEPAPKPK
jgi:hypothetical protein